MSAEGSSKEEVLQPEEVQLQEPNPEEQPISQK